MKKNSLFILLILMFFCCGCDIKNKSEIDGTKRLVIDEYKVLEYENNSWNVLTEINNDSSLWEKYNVYKDNNYVHNYYVKLNNGVAYYFDDAYNSYNIESNLAINEESNLGPIGYDIENLSFDDLKVISNLLKKLEYSSSKNLSVSKKISVNMDKDEDYEFLYIISNYLNEDDYDKVFYIVFLRDKGKDFVIVDNKHDSMKRYDIGWFLNITNGKYYDIILKYDYVESYNYDVYQFIDDEYKLVVDEMDVIEYSDNNDNSSGTVVLFFGGLFIVLLLIYLFFKKIGEIRDKI